MSRAQPTRDTSKHYFQLRKYGLDGGGRRDNNQCYIVDEFDDPTTAYLAAFKMIEGGFNDDYFDQTLDIVEIKPVEVRTFKVNYSTVTSLHQQQIEKLIEIEVEQ